MIVGSRRFFVLLAVIGGRGRFILLAVIGGGRLFVLLAVLTLVFRRHDDDGIGVQQQRIGRHIAFQIGDGDVEPAVIIAQHLHHAPVRQLARLAVEIVGTGAEPDAPGGNGAALQHVFHIAQHRAGHVVGVADAVVLDAVTQRRVGGLHPAPHTTIPKAGVVPAVGLLQHGEHRVVGQGIHGGGGFVGLAVYGGCLRRHQTRNGLVLLLAAGYQQHRQQQRDKQQRRDTQPQGQGDLVFLHFFHRFLL